MIMLLSHQGQYPCLTVSIAVATHGYILKLCILLMKLGKQYHYTRLQCPVFRLVLFYLLLRVVMKVLLSLIQVTTDKEQYFLQSVSIEVALLLMVMRFATANWV